MKVGWGDNNPNEIFHKRFNKIALLHIIMLSVDVYTLDDLALCDFLDYVYNEKNFMFTMQQLMTDVTNTGFSDEMKRKGLHLRKGVTLLIKLPEGSAKFNATKEVDRCACLRRISIETYRDVAGYPEEYRFDECHPSHHTPSPVVNVD